jgi:hypothetical protein
VGVVDVESGIDVGRCEACIGDEEEVFAFTACIEKRRFLATRPRRHESDAACWCATGALPPGLELVDILLAVDILRHEGIPAVEEETSVVGHIVGLVLRAVA